MKPIDPLSYGAGVAAQSSNTGILLGQRNAAQAEAGHWRGWCDKFKQELNGQIKLRNALRDALTEVAPNHPLANKVARDKIINDGIAEEFALQQQGKSNFET